MQSHHLPLGRPAMSLRLLPTAALFSSLLAAPAFAQSASGCDAKALGAKADGKTDDTAALQHAIDTCPVSSGVAVVHLTAGTYLSGPLALRSHVHLLLDKGATLLGTPDMAAYPIRTDAPWRRVSLIHADNVEDIAITGD